MYELGDKRVRTESDAFWIAPNAVVMGDVYLKNDASIWWNAVVRGDNDPITIGAGTNIQDGCVLHTDPGVPLTIGDLVTVGHMVMLHGCTIGEGSLIGIGSIVLNNARIGRNCLIGANTLVKEGAEIPDNSMVVGSPGKVIKSVTPEQAERMRHGTEAYIRNWRRFAEQLKPQ
jgi:carbonic anhydrase/acetyltransferase-like protein (isoleucine patch superfamily)